MFRIWLVVLCFAVVQCAPLAGDDVEPKTPFEKGDGWESAAYEQGIQFYRSLAAASPRVRLDAVGPTDSGVPLHLVLVSGDEDFDIESARRKGRAVLLVNNAIHPGESDGVDASMAFVRDLALSTEAAPSILENVLVAVIPYYNIGGALNRNSVTRVNQNGPREYGFRGNARNYDLNRDFIKCDTLNARSFAQVFGRLDPDLFIDTHVSNGADYQHIMTTAHSQKDKLGQQLGNYLDETFEPILFKRMSKSGYPTIPYVNSGGAPPDQGFAQFLDTPRYSTGYAALFQTIGFMAETHMLKPYPQRVAATRAFLQHAAELLSEQKETIGRLRIADRQAYSKQAHVAIEWQVDKNVPSKLEFRGYQASYIDSRVTTGNRLFYDRTNPFTKDIEYFNHYVPSQSIAPPAAYLIPGGWHKVIDLMKLNGVEMRVIRKATPIEAEVYQFEEVSSRSSPYEGHYFHDLVKATSKDETIMAQPGDVVISLDQSKARYVVETLEPSATDSLFRWNYFDSVLQRKEFFSPYVFEETAAKLLEDDKKLKAQFEKKKADSPDFASDPVEQLRFLYLHSQHAESAYQRYPVARLKNRPPFHN